MTEKELILTYDIGTTGNKCTLFDGSGREICAENVAYKTIYPKPGWAEQDPEDFWRSVITGTRALLERSGVKPSSIAVIGLCGHMNGCIPVDREGQVLFNDIIHSDARSGKECEQILEVFDGDAFFNITGNRVDPHYTFSKILWLKNHYPNIYRKTAYFLNSKDYIAYKLTGHLGITDYSDASLTCMLDIRKKSWAEELIRGMGVDMDKLPAIKRSVDIAGTLTAEAASLLGLPEGIPVAVGGGDGACATKGAGVVEKGFAYNYIGSSSWIAFLNDGPVLDPRLFNFYDLDGEHCNVCGTVQSAAIAYDWVVENIGKHEVERLKQTSGNIHDEMEALARQSPIGSNGVFFLPYLMGERTPIWDQNTKGGFIGVTLFNQRSDLFRAAYEGVAYALRSVIDCLEENKLFVQDLTLIGGGAKSRFWNEVMVDVYNKPLKIHKYPGEATSLGTAIAAGVAVGIFEDFQAAARVIQYDRTYTPNPVRVGAYEKHYRIYRMLYPALKPVYDEMAAL